MLIGLHGLAGSGKDTVYDLIKKDYHVPSSGLHVIRDAFADRLKVSAARALGFNGSTQECIDFCNKLKVTGKIRTTWSGFGAPEISITGREFLQRYGTEAHREVFAYDFWVDAVLPDGSDTQFYGRTDLRARDILVVTDVRFENEAQRILDCGGSIWHIVRDAVNVADDHPSERPLPPEYITLTLDNNGTLEELRKKVNNLVWAEMGTHV